MSSCKHENQYLMGTADGVLCRRCGVLFASFDELNASSQPEENPQEEAAPAPKRARKKKGDNTNA